MTNGSARWIAGLAMLGIAALACSLTGEAGTPTIAAATDTTLPVLATAMPEATATRKPGPCEHTLFPLAEGNRWFYRRVSGDSSIDLNMLVDKVEGETAHINTLNQDTGVLSTTEVLCRDGAILSLPMSQMGLLFYEDAAGTVELEWKKGAVLPAEAAFLDADWDLEWGTDLLAKGDLRVVDPESQETFSLTLTDSPVALVWKTAGKGEDAFEAVTVEAGEFPRALRVLLQAEMEFRADIEGDGMTYSLPGTMVLECTLWFVPEVGLVREIVDSVDLKIAGFRYPVDITAHLELKEFQPAR